MAGEGQGGRARVAAYGRDGEVRGPLPFVLVHGAGGDAGRFAELLALLPGAVGVDLPGHGLATGEARTAIGGPDGYAEALALLLEEEGYERPLLVGHSMGGAVALALALEGRVPLGGLGLVGTGARLRVHPDILAATRAGRVPDGLAAMMLAEGASAAVVAAEAEALARAAATGALHRDFLACDAFDVRERLGELRLPATVVVGSQDRMTPPRRGEELIQGWGAPERIEGVVVDGAGHYVQRERPEAVARALLGLRARVLGGAGR